MLSNPNPQKNHYFNLLATNMINFHRYKSIYCKKSPERSKEKKLKANNLWQCLNVEEIHETERHNQLLSLNHDNFLAYKAKVSANAFEYFENSNDKIQKDNQSIKNQNQWLSTSKKSYCSSLMMSKKKQIEKESLIVFDKKSKKLSLTLTPQKSQKISEKKTHSEKRILNLKRKNTKDFK